MNARRTVPGCALAALLAVVAAPPVQAGRHAIVVGVNDGAPPDLPLSFAEDDADRVADLLTSLAGFEPTETTVLRSTDAETMRRAIVRQNERIRVGDDDDDESVLFVYYSGHADASALRMGGTRFAFEELQALVRGSPARFRVLVVDACRSGALTTLKGGSARAPIDIAATTDAATEGFVVLTSASAGEAAQESRALGGSFFTHHLVSGLLGSADDDDDGAVALDEAYRYAYDNTLRDSSVTLAGSQHPTFRYDLRGQGKLVLTRLASARRPRGRLALPKSADFLVLADDENGRVVAEARRGRGGALWLLPGRYFVRGRAQRSLLEGEVNVAAGRAQFVDEGDLRRVEYTRLVRKGADETVTLVQGPAAFAWGRTGLTAVANPCFGAGAGWLFASRYVNVEPRLSWCRESSKNDVLQATTDEVNAQVRATYTVDLPAGFGVDVGVATGGSWLHQEFVTRGRAPPTDVAAAHVGVTAGAGVDLPWGVVVRGDVEGRTVIVPLKGADGAGAWSTPLVGIAALRIVKLF